MISLLHGHYFEETCKFLHTEITQLVEILHHEWKIYLSYMSYIVSSTAADTMVIQGPRLSAAMVLTKFPGANELIDF